jgi:hypothetical protein
MKTHRYLGGSTDVGSEIDEVRFELREGPREEEDHGRGVLCFGCAGCGDDLFEVVLRSFSSCLVASGTLFHVILVQGGCVKGKLLLQYGRRF